MTAKNQFDRESVPGGCHQGNRKTLPFGETGGRASGAPAIPRYRTSLLTCLQNRRPAGQLSQLQLCYGHNPKAGQGDGPAPGPRGGPVVEPHSAVGF